VKRERGRRETLFFLFVCLLVFFCCCFLFVCLFVLALGISLGILTVQKIVFDVIKLTHTSPQLSNVWLYARAFYSLSIDGAFDMPLTSASLAGHPAAVQN